MKFQPRETTLEVLNGVPVSPGQVSYPREGGGLYLDASDGTRVFYPAAPAVFSIAEIDPTSTFEVGGTVRLSAGSGFRFTEWFESGTTLKILDKGLIRVESLTDTWLTGKVVGSEFQITPAVGDTVVWVSGKSQIDVSAILARMTELEDQIASLTKELTGWRCVVSDLNVSVGITLE